MGSKRVGQDLATEYNSKERRKWNQCQWSEVTAYPQELSENMLCASFIFHSFHYYYSWDFLPCVFRPRLSPRDGGAWWAAVSGVAQSRDSVWYHKWGLSWPVRRIPSLQGKLKCQSSFSLKMLWEERVARRADCKWVLKSGNPGFRSLLPSLQDVGQTGSRNKGHFTGISSLSDDNHTMAWIYSHPNLQMGRRRQVNYQEAGSQDSNPGSLTSKSKLLTQQHKWK